MKQNLASEEGDEKLMEYYCFDNAATYLVPLLLI